MGEATGIMEVDEVAIHFEIRINKHSIKLVRLLGTAIDTTAEPKGQDSYIHLFSY